MMMNVTFALMAESLSWGDRASIAGNVTLLGMGAVFAVLAILWAVIELMHRLLNGKKEKPAKTSEPVAAGTPNTDDAAVAAAIAASLAATEDDGATVAAITAAISAALAEDGYTGGFRVVSFKRVAGANARRRS